MKIFGFIFLVILGAACTRQDDATMDENTPGLPAASPGTFSSGNCCACEIDTSDLVIASEHANDEDSPCDFEIPADWEVNVLSDELLVSVVAGPKCDRCRTPPSITMSIATGPNRNAEAREEAWVGIFPVTGIGQCGEREIRFFNTGGDGPGSLMGGARFHVSLGGELHDGSVSFSCGTPDGWQELEELFLGTFRNNPDTTFPD